MSWSGIRTVAGLELRQRVRLSRWPILLGVWVALIAAVTILTWLSLNDPTVRAGPALHDIVTFFVLGLGMLIVPSLTSTSVNGDREQGVLATLQTTLLTPADLVLGKLVASWVVALTFLATSLPFLAWAFVAGGITAGQVLLSLLMLVVVLAAVCGIGLMFSTLTARPVGSAVLTYLTVTTLVIGTVTAFGIGAVLTTNDEPVRIHGIPESWYREHQPPVEKPATPEEEQKYDLVPTPPDSVTNRGNPVGAERFRPDVDDQLRHPRRPGRRRAGSS